MIPDTLMNEKRSDNPSESGRFSYLWLLAGAVLLVFANGRWIIPLTAWLAPVFIIRFLRNKKPVHGLILVAIILVVVNIIAWQGMIPVSTVLY